MRVGKSRCGVDLHNSWPLFGSGPRPWLTSIPLRRKQKTSGIFFFLHAYILFIFILSTFYFSYMTACLPILSQYYTFDICRLVAPLCLLWLAAPPLGRMSRIKEGASTPACISNQKLGSLCRPVTSPGNLCRGSSSAKEPSGQSGPGAKLSRKGAEPGFYWYVSGLSAKLVVPLNLNGWIICASSKPALWGKATGNDYGDSGGRACVAPCASWSPLLYLLPGTVPLAGRQTGRQSGTGDREWNWCERAGELHKW